MAALALGLGMIFSSLTSKYKDLTFVDFWNTVIDVCHSGNLDPTFYSL